jgi:predicted MPP superfamily phosphohydrolase
VDKKKQKMNPLNFLIPLALLLAIDAYAYQSLRALDAPSWARVTYWCVVLASTLAPLAGMLVMMRWGADAGAGGGRLLSVLALVALPLLLATSVLLLEDIVRLATAAARYVAELKPVLMPRHRWVSIASLSLAGLMLALVTYGLTGGKHRYRVHRQTIYSSQLPPAFDGFRILQLSDIHAGSFSSHSDVQRGIQMAMDEKPDLFVFSGDIVNTFASELEPWAELLSQVKAPYGQYSVLGNHDYGDYARWSSREAKAYNLQQLIITQEAMGWHVLLDESVSIAKDGDTIALIGVQNIGMGMHFMAYGDLKKAMANVDSSSFKILVSHDPSHWDKEVSSYPTLIQLTLSGHTHGFQLGIETPWFRYSPVQWVYPHWAGHYELNHRQLYVNRGFGYIPFFLGRVGIWPEITVLELRCKQG